MLHQRFFTLVRKLDRRVNKLSADGEFHDQTRYITGNERWEKAAYPLLLCS